MSQSKNQPIIGIIGGKGQMGRLFADFFAENGVEVLISDLATKLTNQQLAQKADIVLVSVSMGKAEEVIKEIAPLVRADALLTDITSIKEAPTKAMKKCAGETLGLHPMFGFSNPIPGQLIIYCPLKSGKWTKWLLDFFKKQTVELIKLTPREHDEAMAFAQGIIHFSEIAFAHALFKLKKPVRDVLKFTGIASDLRVLLAGRVINQDPHLYGNIQIMNGCNVATMKQLLKSVEELFKIVKKKKTQKFNEYFNDAKKFWGAYGDEAYKESSWIIDQVLAERRTKKIAAKTAKVTKVVSPIKSVATLGPEGTFSSIAASHFIADPKNKSSKLQPAYYSSIDKVFEAQAQGKVKYSIVPVENKINGSVRETLDNLFLHKVQIIGELSIPINHCLVALPTTDFSKITTIASHQQALSQCHKYLEKHFPNRSEEALGSTAAGIHKLLVTQNRHLGVIAPIEVAQNNNLKIIAQNIEDEKNNSTRFFVLKKGVFSLSQDQQSGDTDNVAIAFHFGENMPGTLFSVFEIFAKAKINLTKIESRPTTPKFGNYIFYLDFKGNIQDSKIKNALNAVEKKVKKLKILGSY